MTPAPQPSLITYLTSLPSETEWLEFKENQSDPERISRDISALANAAAMHEREYAYKVWGVKDDTHELVGTTFNQNTAKGPGTELLLPWLRRMISSDTFYEFNTLHVEGKTIVVLTIHASTGKPSSFSGIPFIRTGPATTRLRAGSTEEAELWRRLQRSTFELHAAEEGLRAEDIPDRLDAPTFFRQLGLNQPSTLDGILQAFIEQELIKPADDGTFTITNLGALLLATKLTSFPTLRKRPLRIIRYDGNGNFAIISDTIFDKGYALALPEAEATLANLNPPHETTDGAFRRITATFPQTAIREFMVNAVLHQDLSDSTTSPLIQFYDNRIVFSNPGASLISVDRILNAPPRTRNERLANLLRQMDLCEEGGTGWDVAVAACEAQHLPAPRITTNDAEGTTVMLQGPKRFSTMSNTERAEATYWHACLLYAQGEALTNASLRERFNLSATNANSAAVSRIISSCIQNGTLKAEDPLAGPRSRRYVPAWA